MLFFRFMQRKTTVVIIMAATTTAKIMATNVMVGLFVKALVKSERPFPA